MDIPALVALSFVASITPGPNNLMLIASGMNHGIRRTMPHVAGVSLGFAFLIFVVAMGLGTVFERYSAIEQVLKVLGGLYLLYLAWRIFNTTAVRQGEATERPMTFVEAALFQWVNPKAWVFATTATSTLLVTTSSVVAGAAALTFGIWIVNLPCILAWLVSGAAAAQWVNDDRRTMLMNRFLGVLLAGTVILLFV
jgi:threonine/homoserine/homoserine lactone efflux protein